MLVDNNFTNVLLSLLFFNVFFEVTGNIPPNVLHVILLNNKKIVLINNRIYC